MAKPKYKNMDKKPPTVASVSKIRLKTQYTRTQQYEKLNLKVQGCKMKSNIHPS